MDRLAQSVLLRTLIALLLIGLTSCSSEDLSFEAPESRTVSGVLKPLAIASSQSVSTLSCTSPVAKIYALNSAGEKLLPELAEGVIEDDGSYQIFVESKSFAIRNSEGSKYLVEADGCTDDFSRVVTHNRDQDLDYGSSLIAYTVGTSLGSTLTSIQRDGLGSFFESLNSTASLTASYSDISSNTSKANQFTSLFGSGPQILLDLPPKYLQSNVPTEFDEHQSHPLSLNTYHWSPTYPTAVLWKVGNDIIDTGDNITWTPDANTQGSRTITVYWGQEDGVGDLDQTKPFDSKSFTVQIDNTVPATPPPISTPAVSGGYNINIDIDTGNAFANCESFSTMALTEDDLFPPASSAFTIECTDAVTQTLAHTLGPGVGTKTLRLWVKDSAGNISVTSSTATVTLDSTAPAVSLDTLSGGDLLRGGDTVDIDWTATDSSIASNPISLYYSIDSGSTWTLIDDELSNSGTYSWTVPSISDADVRIKVEAVDQAGNVGSDESGTDLAIDSTPPSAPVISITSAALSNSLTATIGVTCDTDYAGIYFSGSSTQPAHDATGWSTCSASMNYSVAAGDGIKTIYAWTKDLAGNVSSTSDSDSYTLDQTDPAIALTSHNSGIFKGGTLTALSWTATDTHWGSGTVDIQTSQDDGSTWSDLAMNTANDGAYSFTFPSIDNGQYRVKVSGCDEAGNCADAISTSALKIDITAPVITSMTINDGSAYAGTALTGVKAGITDNLDTLTNISVRTSNAHPVTGDCQSEYADSGWRAYTNATTDISHQVTPMDGVKKVCIWAKDSVGNVTVFSPTTGTLGVDMDTIIFEIGNPPTIVGFALTRNGGGTVASVGDAMTITWNVTDIEGLNNNPMSFAYTTDNIVWKDIYTNGDISTLSNVTWIGSLSGNPTTANGTITTWTAPSNTYFRMKAVTRDKSGNYSIPILSQTFNSGGWSIFAGSKDRGVGGSGPSAALYNTPAGTFVAINPISGDIYALDVGYGIKKLDAKTGLVSTAIQFGTLNLPNDGPLPAVPTLSDSGGYQSLHFDSKGRLYISEGSANDKIYQIDFNANHVRLYAGGGTNNDGGVASTTLRASNLFTFDESDNMYLATMCAPYAYPHDQGKRIVKIVQNADGTPGTVTRIIGDCTYAAPNYGGSAYSSPAGDFRFTYHSDLLAFNNGNTIYFASYGNVRWKIVNGIVYSINLGSNSCTGEPSLTYDPSNNKLYHANVNCGIDEITLGGAQNGGETKTTLFDGNVVSPGCTEDGTSMTSACTKIAWLDSFGGTLYFSDGIGLNSGSNYRVRYIDGSSKMRTMFGGLPFMGDGMDKSVIRSMIAGIYYKKATEPNQAVFPEGLYFIDSDAGVFGRIDPSTDTTEVLWGNQARQAGGYSNGDTISKDLSMGAPYVGGSLMPLTFDSTGLPWMRVTHNLVKVNTSKQIEYKMYGSTYWHDLADGADPRAAYLSPYAARNSFTLKGQAMFLLGGAYVYPTVDPNIAIRLLDFGSLTTTRILGGTYLHSDSPPQSPDLASGVASAPLWYNCYFDKCHTEYDAGADRLYFNEYNKVRYITTPSNTATSTLVTLFQSSDSSSIYNFTLNPARTQVWYVTDSTTLRCRDISSGKSWCDDTTNHFQAAADAGLSFYYGGVSMFTWKDGNTLLLSTYSGEVLQYSLPTAP